MLQFVICSFLDSSDEEMRSLAVCLSIVRILEHFIYIILASIWIFVPFTCSSCPPVEDRENFILGSGVGIFILVYAYLGVCIHPFLLAIFVEYFWEEEASAERDLELMLSEGDVGGIADMLCFGVEVDTLGEFPLSLCESFTTYKGSKKEDDLWDACVAMIERGYDVHARRRFRNGPQTSLLHVAAEVGWAKFVIYLLENSNAWQVINKIHVKDTFYVSFCDTSRKESTLRVYDVWQKVLPYSYSPLSIT